MSELRYGAMTRTKANEMRHWLAERQIQAQVHEYPTTPGPQDRWGVMVPGYGALDSPGAVYTFARGVEYGRQLQVREEVARESGAPEIHNEETHERPRVFGCGVCPNQSTCGGAGRCLIEAKPLEAFRERQGRPCVYGCGLEAAPGDVMCAGCRSGHTGHPGGILEAPR